MDKWLINFVLKEIKWKKIVLAPIDVLLLVCMTIASVLLRRTVHTYTWLPEQLLNAQADHTLMFTAMFAQFGGFLVDFVISVLVALLIYKLTNHKIKAMIGYCVAIILPTLVASNMMWNVYDNIFVCIVLLALYFVINEKFNWAVLIYGISLFYDFKGLFLLPLFFLLYFMEKGTLKLTTFLSPLGFVLLRTYLISEQSPIKNKLFEAQQYIITSRFDKQLSYNYPNIYEIIGVDKFVSEYTIVGTCFAIGMGLVFMSLLLIKEVQPTKVQVIELALFLMLALAFVSPGMNERSGLLMDVLALVFGLSCLKKFYIPIIQVIVSYVAYSVFLRGESVMNMTFVAFIGLAIIVDLLYDLSGLGVKNEYKESK